MAKGDPVFFRACRLDFDSAYFEDCRYEAIQNHLIIFGGKNGTISIARENLQLLAKELLEIDGVWGDVST